MTWPKSAWTSSPHVTFSFGATQGEAAVPGTHGIESTEPDNEYVVKCTTPIAEEELAVAGGDRSIRARQETKKDCDGEAQPFALVSQELLDLGPGSQVALPSADGSNSSCQSPSADAHCPRYRLGEQVCAAAASGSLLALTALEFDGVDWRLLPRLTRSFHLKGRGQEELRDFARKFYDFVGAEQVKSLSLCRTLSGLPDGGLADEVRIEVILGMMPGLEIHLEDSEKVAIWAIETDVSFPSIAESRPRNLAEWRSLELAWFSIAQAKGSDRSSDYLPG